MKFLPSLILLAVMVLAFTENSEAIPPVVIATLVQQGQELSAPFTKTSMQRLHSEVFGSGRAARSSDIIVFNSSDRDFFLSAASCSWGGFSTNMFPENRQPKDSTTVYGIESNGFMAGVTCKVEYTSRDGAWFVMDVDNSYIGHNVVGENHSENLRVFHILGQGNNNQVKFIIRDA